MSGGRDAGRRPEDDGGSRTSGDPASRGESTRTSATVSGRAPSPLGAYPHARRVGDLLFLSGIGPRQGSSGTIPGVELDAEGRVASYDIVAQCHAVFANVRTVLEDAGAAWDDIVDVTVFLIDMAADFEAYNRIYEEYFGGVRPTRTTVEVGALPGPIAIELKVIATI
jgi:2-aminomuconate deaminase